MKRVDLIKMGILICIPLICKLSLEAKYKITPPELAFQLDEYGDPFDPLSYSPYDLNLQPIWDCPSTGYICVIEVYDDEIYTPIDIPIPAYWGKPRVGEGTLQSDITAALSASSDPYLSSTGRQIWRKY